MLHHESDSSWLSDPVIRLLEGSESPISALFNFYAGKTSEKLISLEYSIHFLPIVCIKTQKLGSHSEQFRMSENEYTLRPGFSELFLTSIAAWILDWVDSEVNALICPLAVKILVKLNHIAHPLNLACISLAITRLNTGTSACRWPSLVR